MDSNWYSTYEIAAYASFTLLSCGLAWHIYAVSKRARIRELEGAVLRLDATAEEHRHLADDLLKRNRTAEETVRRLERSLAEMPEIAQRLAVTRDLRQIPGRTLELVQEIFGSSYSVFYRRGKDQLIAAACLGESEFGVGHRVKWGEGVVGWTAVKQLPFTPEDAQHESGMVRARNLSTGLPAEGFSLCLPILNGEQTIGVILIGPTERSLPHMREIGRTIALIASVTITSAAVLKQQKLLAKTDGLTGLFNKTHVLKGIRDLIASEQGPPRVVSVFLFDIDHFKQYNDSNGHLPGDELLKSLSTFLNDSIRGEEFLGRYGGEEFLLVMPNAGKRDALRAAERIRELIEKNDFPFQENQPGGNLTVSGGVATWPNDGDELDKLIGCADEALYQAKRGGRNRVCAYSPSDLAMSGSCDPVSGIIDLLSIDDEKPEF